MQDTARAEHFAAELLREIESLNGDNSPKDNTNSKKKNQKLKAKKK